MSQELGLDREARKFPLSDRFAGMGGSPANDDDGDQVEPGHAGPYSNTSPMTATLIGYARCSTDRHDLAAQRQALMELGVAEDRTYSDHGLTGTTRARPGLNKALAAVREGDTLVVPKLDRLARSVPDARDIADQLQERGVRLALGPTLYDPGDPMGKMLFNILATFAEFEADLIRMRTREGMDIASARGNCAASSPISPTVSSGSSAACMPQASIPSAILQRSSPSQDQPSIAHSTGAIPLSLRFCPRPESTRC